MSMRSGLHTGEGTLGGDNYVGLDVHRAARIGAAAHGGQVLLSETTRGLSEGSLPPDLSLIDLGHHRLKDLDQPERLSQLVVAGHPRRPGLLLVKRAARLDPGGWYLASDNPGAGAADSAQFGPVPAALIEGTLLLRYPRGRPGPQKG